MAGTWFRAEGANIDALLKQAAEAAKAPFEPKVMPDEDAVSIAQLAELRTAAAAKPEGETVSLALLGGRGAQGLYKLLRRLAVEGDPLIKRLDVYTQDAFVPMRKDSSLTFVRYYESQLGPEFFSSIRRFTTIDSEAADLEEETKRHIAQLPADGFDIMLMGHGPEPSDCSHVAYIRAGSAASIADAAGLCPVSDVVLEHHVSKFKACGASISAEDEAECRKRSNMIWTIGPETILKSKRIVQSVVDASTATAKKRTYQKVLETKLAVDDLAALQQQLQENPGLYARCHPNVASLILPDVLDGFESATKKLKT